MKIEQFKSIFDDKILNNNTSLSNDLMNIFPKLYNYSDNRNYYGLNVFTEKHIFDQPSKKKNIEYLVSDKITSKLFIKNEFNNISKTKDEITKVFDKYVDLFSFFFDFMSFKIKDLDESTIKYINDQKQYIKLLKDIKHEYKMNYEKYKKEDNNKKKEMKEGLDKLLATKVTNQSLIYTITKEWKLSKINLDIIDTQLLKTNIVPFFIKNFPLLIMHKTNDLGNINNSKSNKKELLNETLKEIVHICKQLPLKDEELIKCLESSMILSGHFKAILKYL